MAAAGTIYLSRLIATPIVDAEGDRLGLLADLAVDLQEALPKVTGLLMRGDRSRVALFPWNEVEEIGPPEVILRVPRRHLQPRPLQPEEQLLGEILDTQVVDIDGLKVVRVNDLQLWRANGEVRLVAADVGTSGLLRRMSLDAPASAVARLLGRRLPERLIPWKMVAAFGGPMTPIKLSISRARLREIHPADLADLLEDLDRDERVEVMTALEHEDAADALAEAESEIQADVIKSLPSDLAADILDEMAPDDATDVLADLPPDRAQELINLMDSEEAADVRTLLKFPEGTAGSVMTTEFISLPQRLTAAEALERMRRLAPVSEEVYYIYVVTDAGHLLGVLPLRALITARPDQRIEEITTAEVISVGVDDSVEDVAAALTKYDLLALPVTDDGRLAGVVTVDDVIDVVLRKGRRRVPARFRARARPRTNRRG